jgi:hypothetical protein
MAGVGLECSSNHILFDVNGGYHTANVMAGAGHTGTLQVSGYYTLFGRLIVGAGANWVINTNGFSTSHYINSILLASRSTRSSARSSVPECPIRRFLSADGGRRHSGADQVRLEFRTCTYPACPVHRSCGCQLLPERGPLRSLSGRRVSVTQAGAGVKPVFNRLPRSSTNAGSSRL